MKLDRYQSEVSKLIARCDTSAVGQARAGCGKTATALAGLSAINYKPTTRTGMVVFNTRNKDEMKERAAVAGLPVVDRPAEAGAYFATHHSFGRSLLFENGHRHRVLEDKARFKLKDEWESRPANKGKDAWKTTEFYAHLPALELIDAAMTNGVEPTKKNADWFVSEAEGILTNLTPDQLAETATKTMKLMEADSARVNFSEMIYLPYVKGYSLKQPFPLLIADEAQDLTRVQRELCLRNARNVVVIGDDRQAIYGWRGADCDSMNGWSAALSSADSKATPYRGILPMPVNYRCGRAIISLAQRLVPDIQAHDGAPEGEVNIDQGFLADQDDPSDVSPFWRRYADTIRPGDMVICRNNAPLVKLYVGTLRDSRLPQTYYQGVDFGRELERLYRQVSAGRFQDFPFDLERFKATKIVPMQLVGKASQAEALLDKLECVEILWQATSDEKEMLLRMAELGSPSRRANSVILSTGHRAKGLEADSVYWLRPDLLPHPRATGEQYPQELNLAYVVTTRARHTLTVCGDLPPAFAIADTLTGNKLPQPKPTEQTSPTGRSPRTKVAKILERDIV